MTEPKKRQPQTKWPWADIKAQYYIAYPMTKSEFFAKYWPQISQGSIEASTVGWKEERGAYREKFALENMTKYIESAEKTAEAHREEGRALMGASLEKLVTKVWDTKKQEWNYVLNSNSMEPADIIRAFVAGARVENQAVDIRRGIATVHKDANEKPEKEPIDKARTVLDLILHSPKALKAAKEILKALPSA